MKRRDPLKSAAAIATIPFSPQWARAIPVSGENTFLENPDKKTNGIPHFGNGPMVQASINYVIRRADRKPILYYCKKKSTMDSRWSLTTP